MLAPPPPPTPAPPVLSRAQVATIVRDHVAAELEHFAAMLGDEIAELRRHERKHVAAQMEKLRDEIAALRAESRAHNEVVQLRAEIDALRGERAKVIDLPNPIRRGAA